MRAAGIWREVAADRASTLARRIGRVMISGPFEPLRQMDIDQAGFDDGVAVAEIDLENPLHPRKCDHDSAADGKAPARQARARAAGDKGEVELVARLHNGHDL